MRFDFSHSLVPRPIIRAQARTINSYLVQLSKASRDASYRMSESSLALASDGVLMKRVEEAVRALRTSRLRYVVVVGIGGSNLGTKAVYDALQGCSDALQPGKIPKMVFLDTIEPMILAAIKRIVEVELTDKGELALFVISKSGITIETLAIYRWFKDLLEKRFGHSEERIVAITDEASPLWRECAQNTIQTLPIPYAVGGRYSILSAVGLAPLLACGINVGALRNGARSMRTLCLSRDIKKNPAARSALALWHHALHGRSIHDTFLFRPALESFGRWYRQLLAESIGKEYDAQGKRVCVGITPTASIGSTDLHSVGQLAFGGPQDKWSTVIRSKQSAEPLGSKSLERIMPSIIQGLERAYVVKRMPFIDVCLERISAEEIGALFQWKMIEVMILGRFFNVNAFDQPAVELYKAAARKALGK